ncbi:hypothetical protein [Streptomyces sp. NPDC014806]|uniref:hypothetical protein n=1 Tax=Streptomyces sp. NPDC014806 TaxID=3364920 RepID=UPI0036FCDC47
MAHRPYPSRERARRQIDRHYERVEPWAAARPRPLPPPDETAPDLLWSGQYRLSTR